MTSLCISSFWLRDIGFGMELWITRNSDTTSVYCTPWGAISSSFGWGCIVWVSWTSKEGKWPRTRDPSHHSYRPASIVGPHLPIPTRLSRDKLRHHSPKGLAVVVYTSMCARRGRISVNWVCWSACLCICVYRKASVWKKGEMGDSWSCLTCLGAEEPPVSCWTCNQLGLARPKCVRV